MEIVKIIGIAFLALIIVIILKQYKPEFAMYVSILAGAIILFISMGKLTGIINLLEDISSKTAINGEFLSILIKITGIANKVDMGGKVIIVAISIPIVSALLETVIKILP